MNSPFSFRQWVRQQQLPYSILAVQTEIDALVPELQKLFQIQSHQPYLPLTGKLSDLEGVPIVKFKGNPWCVVYWSIGRALSLEDDCRILSGKLSARVLHLTERDTSGQVEWSLYEKREALEVTQWMTHDDRFYAERAVINQFIHETFIQEGIYIPTGDMKVSDTYLERVDWIQRS